MLLCGNFPLIFGYSFAEILLGTANGTIRAMKYPFGNDPGEHQEHQAHSSSVTKIRVAYDDSYLFSVSEDGCLYTYKISDKEGRGVKKSHEVSYADEVMI
jgi:WD40 repeat protein